jgi:acyl-CoA thioester hydrolase
VTDKKARDSRDDFQHFHYMTTRWMDNDIYGHVNNVVYYSWFDSAVNAMLIHERIAGENSPETMAVVVATQCQYFQSVAYPEPVEIGLKVARLGSSSVTYRLATFTAGSDLSHASCDFTHVYVDPVTRRPMPIPDRHRAVLQRYENPSEQAPSR